MGESATALVPFLIMISFLSSAGVASASSAAPEVATLSGVVSGTIVRGTNAFLGIPYAAAPGDWEAAVQPRLPFRPGRDKLLREIIAAQGCAAFL